MDPHGYRLCCFIFKHLQTGSNPIYFPAWTRAVTTSIPLSYWGWQDPVLQPSPSERDEEEEEELQGFSCHPGATPAPLAQQGVILGAGSPWVDARTEEGGRRGISLGQALPKQCHSLTHKVINESKLPGNCCYEEEEEPVLLHPALHWAGQG